MRRFGVGGGMEWSSTSGDILFRADALPGWDGVVVPRRLRTYEMESLSRTFGAEFSLQYVAGPGRNGGGGIYRLYSGTYRNVHVPTGPDVFWISHTHTSGIERASGHTSKTTGELLRGDQFLLWRLQERFQSPQQTSTIIPVGGSPFRFSVAEKHIPIR